MAVAVSGLAGATYAAKRGFDAIGILGLTFATGLGGLLLRDILLQQGTPIIFTRPIYLVTAILTALLGFFFAGLIARFSSPLVILEGLALGFLSTAGAGAALSVGLNWSSAIFIGGVTAVGGQVLRDVLVGTAPQIVRPGVFFAVPAIVSSAIFVIMIYAEAPVLWAQLLAMVVAMALRIGAYWFGWSTGSAADLSTRVWEFWGSVGKLAPIPEPPTGFIAEFERRTGSGGFVDLADHPDDGKPGNDK